jgi:hypothetical protein
LSDEFRKGDIARPVGEGKYAIVRHQDHAELAYILELPKEPGEAQKELGIEKEASYIIKVINPAKPVPEGYPSAEQSPQYPDSIQQEFKDENFKLNEYNTNRLLTKLWHQRAQTSFGRGHCLVCKSVETTNLARLRSQSTPNYVG